MRYRIGVLVLVMLCMASDQAEATLFRLSRSRRFKGRRFGLVTGVDPYKSYTSISLDLKKRKPLDRTKPDDLGMSKAMASEGKADQSNEEIHFYRQLFRQSLKPGYILLEVDYFPLTHVGTSFFEGKDSRFRLINSGYDQFVSYTVFLGELLPFFTKTPGRKRPSQTGWAMAGFLVTISNWRVSQNISFRDDWFNVQWKVMAQNNTATKSMRWRGAVGFTFHNNGRFQDALTFEVSRTRIDRSFNGFSLLRNASITYATEIPIDRSINYDSLQDYFRLHRFTYGKYMPFKRLRNTMFQLTVGFSWERVKLFSPTRFENNFQVLVGPNVSF